MTVWECLINIKTLLERLDERVIIIDSKEVFQQNQYHILVFTKLQAQEPMYRYRFVFFLKL